jgi:hypothetical protein
MKSSKLLVERKYIKLQWLQNICQTNSDNVHNVRCDKVKADEMSRVCSMYRKDEKCIQNVGWKSWCKRTTQRT